MPNARDLQDWLCRHVGELRCPPDIVTEAPGPVVRLRWHEMISCDGTEYGLGVDLHPGPCLGQLWLYGSASTQARLGSQQIAALPPSVRVTLRRTLLSHLSDREHDWGRGHGLFTPDGRAEAIA